ncbi:hypothetical protein OZN62_12850 [Aurantiacibacter sp. MUD11]|uniref:DUF3617 family protein n=1 Tax=Aurantiacibacter sp. MUD11 TaxID=3003265 RepID=UPI0022AAEA38|nr:DUF3617 family protein [Aurantiacibacter sp. MUD11]WAT17786.1 hypothetical protein OZN62_12850 [Aurantiacibacter sp. MUD11]
MPRPAAMLLAALPMLAACAEDDPDNIPLRGNWEMATQLDSLTIDGTIVRPEMLPPEIARLNASEARCGEPVFSDRQGQQDVLDWRAGGACEFETYEVNGARVTTTGQCRNVGGMETFNPRFDASVVQREDNFRMVVSMEGSAEIPGEGTHYLKIIAVQEGNRTGDC